MDVGEVVARMDNLLRGRTELLRGFNLFLPWSYIRAHGPAGGNSP
jgi:histone deacetylase complex regulatory component SIN3